MSRERSTASQRETAGGNRCVLPAKEEASQVVRSVYRSDRFAIT